MCEDLALGERSGNAEVMLMTGITAAVCAEKVADGRIDHRGSAPLALLAEKTEKQISIQAQMMAESSRRSYQGQLSDDNLYRTLQPAVILTIPYT